MNEKELYQSAMQKKAAGNKEEAIQILTNLIEMSPNSPEAEIARAVRYNLKEENDYDVASSPTSDNIPILSIIFFVLAALSFLGAIILVSVFWPGDPGYGYEWKADAYTLSIVWFSVGVVQTAVFAAIGQGLYYLHKIAIYTSK